MRIGWLSAGAGRTRRPQAGRDRAGRWPAGLPIVRWLARALGLGTPAAAARPGGIAVAATPPQTLSLLPRDARAGLDGHAVTAQRHDRGDRRRAGRQTTPGWAIGASPHGWACPPRRSAGGCGGSRSARSRSVLWRPAGRIGSTRPWGGSRRGAVRSTMRSRRWWWRSARSFVRWGRPARGGRWSRR